MQNIEILLPSGLLHTVRTMQPEPLIWAKVQEMQHSLQTTIFTQRKEFSDIYSLSKTRVYRKQAAET